jgi:hypothetical protein
MARRGPRPQPKGIKNAEAAETRRGGAATKRHLKTQSAPRRKGPEGYMRNARKQERTCSLNLYSCLPVFLIQSLLRFGRLKNLRDVRKSFKLALRIGANCSPDASGLCPPAFAGWWLDGSCLLPHLHRSPWIGSLQ